MGRPNLALIQNSARHRREAVLGREENKFRVILRYARENVEISKCWASISAEVKKKRDLEGRY